MLEATEGCARLMGERVDEHPACIDLAYHALAALQVLAEHDGAQAIARVVGKPRHLRRLRRSARGLQACFRCSIGGVYCQSSDRLVKVRSGPWIQRIRETEHKWL
jgi:hypothetical protein